MRVRASTVRNCAQPVWSSARMSHRLKPTCQPKAGGEKLKEVMAQTHSPYSRRMEHGASGPPTPYEASRLFTRTT